MPPVKGAALGGMRMPVSPGRLVENGTITSTSIATQSFSDLDGVQAPAIDGIVSSTTLTRPSNPNDPAADYQMLDRLGTGAFGVVWRAIHLPTQTEVAIKQIDLESSDDDISELQEEIGHLTECDPAFVTRYYGSFVKGFKLWIVMEYLAGGSCLDVLKPTPFSEYQIAVICRELLKGLAYLHAKGKIHRDIKAANVLLSNAGDVKLADFGVAAQLTQNKSKRNTLVGTPFWMAPEVILQNDYGSKADIWSLGITLIELALGRPPLSEYNPMDVLFLIPKAKPPELEGDYFSSAFKELVSACLTKNADARPSASDLLQHRFVRLAGRTSCIVESIERHRHWKQTSTIAKAKIVPDYRPDPTLVASQGDAWTFDTVRTQATVMLQPNDAPVELSTATQLAATVSRLADEPQRSQTTLLKQPDGGLSRKARRPLSMIANLPSEARADDASLGEGTVKRGVSATFEPETMASSRSTVRSHSQNGRTARHRHSVDMGSTVRARELHLAMQDVQQQANQSNDGQETVRTLARNVQEADLMMSDLLLPTLEEARGSSPEADAALSNIAKALQGLASQDPHLLLRLTRAVTLKIQRCDFNAHQSSVLTSSKQSSGSTSHLHSTTRGRD
ncbi:uncharacterized protein L969DRAFT_58762 [Mixia osmundae IAM 14324]|uniref:uncharacterized protein n=1 Tax=Mixia osmundae (strain CBS 9802 / IAM 14324 / JCM 22182 / KY 12970) TaxID=764103 RepID=UPI0004A54970|nr:uncharacterized protein L969DRAFT_58762 [Mixia osmundae IAM 14324]KEI41580.1 hypothetical protein L969DRAFT_58762 [Mixia osmundae IAM 14324]